jgi:hypothetical protein
VSRYYSNLTFLNSPRNCIREKFTKSELKALIVVFIGTFQIEIVDPNEVVTPTRAIITKLKNGIRLRLKVLGG